jgi:hypothetical protein
MPKTDKLSVAITIKFSIAETEDLKARASTAAVPLRTYIRRNILASKNTSLDSELVLAEQARMQELLVRLWAAAGEKDFGPEQVYEIAKRVDAIENRLLVMRARGRKL